MEAFATTEDYDARFPGRTVSDQTMEECLLDASYAIADALGKRGIDYADPDEDLAERMRRGEVILPVAHAPYTYNPCALKPEVRV